MPRAIAGAASTPLVGATHKKARTVKDGNLITAGGVTSGIDFGLSVSAEIAGEQVAEAIQLELEYNLAPPLSHPDQAPRGFVEGLAGGYNQMNAEFRAALEAITRR
jgi:cyclohexyl-isocyanide hydratase